jgi:carbonic anhydrase
MTEITQLIENNKAWSERMAQTEDNYFEKLSAQQEPDFLWIGCSDSRVPANEIIGLMPGELFVHRNVANLVYAADLNCLSVIQYAVNALKVRHIIVCGHYGCGGVKAAMQHESHGLIDNWLNRIRDLYARHREDIKSLSTEEQRVDRLCELNVIEQVKGVAHTTIVQEAWARGQELSVHGWIYGLKNGLIKDLGVRIDALDQVATTYRIVGAKEGH